MITFKPMNQLYEFEWLLARARPLIVQDTQGLVALDDHGRIQAAAAFDSFTVDACSVHFAIDNPFVIRSGFLHEIARHLFVALNRKRIFGMVPSDNKKALKLDKHIGFREVAVIPDGFAENIDYIILRMDRDTCPWLSDKQKQEAA